MFGVARDGQSVTPNFLSDPLSIAGLCEARIGESRSDLHVREKRHNMKNFFHRVRAPGVTRTPDPRIRNPMLYPAELRAQN
jgi:hypothetical protein